MSARSGGVPPVYVFCDFDGTIARDDIGDAIVRRFGDFERLHAELMDGKMSVAQYWSASLATFPAGLQQRDVDDFTRDFQLDAYFARFVEFCRRRDWPLTVVSDGFDNYIRPMLAAAGLDALPVFANRALFSADAAPRAHFPNADEACGCFCASCKRNVLITQIPDDAIVIYVGDGYSDTCAAEHADVIFARDRLAAYCNKERLPHFPFSSFFDVIALLETTLAGRGLQMRHQAQLRRRRAFISE